MFELLGLLALMSRQGLDHDGEAIALIAMDTLEEGGLHKGEELIVPMLWCLGAFFARLFVDFDNRGADGHLRLNLCGMQDDVAAQSLVKSRGLVSAVLILLALFGCKAPPRFDICRYRGNSNSENFCVVSYVYLMAHPEQFEGRDVEFRAWTRVASDTTLLFPTKEAMDDGESVSSMVVHGEAMAPDLLQRAHVARVLVRGRFYLSEGKVHPLDAERLGVIQNAVILP